MENMTLDLGAAALCEAVLGLPTDPGAAFMEVGRANGYMQLANHNLAQPHNNLPPTPLLGPLCVLSSPEPSLATHASSSSHLKPKGKKGRPSSPASGMESTIHPPPPLLAHLLSVPYLER